MGPHWTGILIVAILLLVLFGGRGRISALMGDFAKGITSFRKGLKDEEESASEESESEAGEPSSIDAEPSDDDKTGG
jgi:sec-independent protein translocase protein TatA